MACQQMINCVVLGDKGVGKSSLIKSYISDKSHGAFTPSVENNHWSNASVSTGRANLSLWIKKCDSKRAADCAQIYSQANALLICFSLVCPRSYDNARARWYAEVSPHCPNAPIILVGTKLDLRDDREVIDELESRKLAPVTELTGKLLAGRIRAVKYVECSAITLAGVNCVFQEVERAVLPYARPLPIPPQGRKKNAGRSRIVQCLLSPFKKRNSPNTPSSSNQVPTSLDDDCVYGTVADLVDPAKTDDNTDDKIDDNMDDNMDDMTIYKEISPAATNYTLTPKKDASKAVLIGDEGVGKSSIFNSYTSNEPFYLYYVPTDADDCAQTECTIGDRSVTLGLWDTSGSKDFDRVRPENYRQTGVFLICFSLISPSTLDSVRTRWHPEVKQHCPDTPIILVGTKADLRQDQTTLERLHRCKLTPVTQQQGEEMADEIGAECYMECSSLTQEGLTEVIQAVARYLPQVDRSFEVEEDHYKFPVSNASRVALQDSEAIKTGLRPPPVPKHRMPPIPQHPNTKALMSDCLPVDAYPQTAPQGVCLVINIENYDNHARFPPRIGSQIDVERVKCLFTELNFHVSVYKDLRCHEIAELLSKQAISEELVDHGCFVCFLMAHGANGLIYGSDTEGLEIQSITERFRGNQCIKLRHKPKIFVIQACRGDNCNSERKGAVDQVHSSTASSYCPPESDFLLYYATPEGYLAIRDEQAGSPVIQTLCDVIEERHDHEHISDMMTTTNRRLKETPVKSGGSNLYAVPEIVSRLSMKCFLNRRV